MTADRFSSVVCHLSSDIRPRIADALALAIMAAVAIIAALTFRDYGLGWDDYTHAEYGGLLLNLYSSGLSHQRALSFVNLYAYGGGFDMLTPPPAQMLPLHLFQTRRRGGAPLRPYRV